MLFLIHRTDAFGDTLMGAMGCAILRDNGYDAVWWDDYKEMRALCDVPLWDQKAEVTRWRWHHGPEDGHDGRTIQRRAMDNFAAEFKTAPIRITRRHAPIRYHYDPRIDGADVALKLDGGPWSPYRHYPYADQLKAELTRRGITWIDLAGKEGQTVLNIANKSRLYLGVDTGTTHFVAAVQRRGIVLQSGWNTPCEWDHGYGYDILQVPGMTCAPCFLRSGCPHDHRCMKELPVSRVADAVQKRLAEDPAKPKVKIFGLQRTGTNLASHLIARNFECELLTTPETGWKHGQLEPWTCPPDTKYVLCVKHPLAWLVSVFRYYRDYAGRDVTIPPQFSRSMSFADFCLSPSYHHESPVYRWGEWYQRWLNVLPAEQTAIVRAEDQAVDQLSVLTNIERSLRLPRLSDRLHWETRRIDVDGIVKGAMDSGYYHDQKYLSDYSPYLLAKVKERIDPLLLQRFGYQL